MPKNTTVNQKAAAKAKKQKIILIGGLVLLLALGALQGPKLLKKSGGQATPATSTDVGQPVSETPAVGTTPAASTPTVVVAGKKVGTVAGVPLTAGASVTPAANQLVSFTLFESKDPFVPGEDSSTELTPEQAASDAYYNQHGEAPPQGSTGDAAAGQGSTGTGTATTPAGAPAQPGPPPKPIYATIDFDGKLQQLTLKDKFPADQPLFVLRSLKKKTAKIAVAGGSFDDSETFTLKLNKKVTLVNTATGVRYVLKLVYTGATPEVIEGFTTTPQTGSTGSTATTTTTTTTTDTTSTANAG